MGELALVACATPRDPSGDDLAPLGDEVFEPAHVLVVDHVDTFCAELADFPAAEPPALDRLLWCRNRHSSSIEGP
jgi:hypothetical protein